MYITETNRAGVNGKRYRCVLLRQSYRQGKQVKNRTLANLSSCASDDIEAIRLALRHKSNLAALGAVHEALEMHQGPALGAIWVLDHVASRLGIDAVLPGGRRGVLARWQVLAQVLAPGLSHAAVRLAQIHAVAEVLGLSQPFDEHDLEANLRWLAGQRARIEKQRFDPRDERRPPVLFGYEFSDRPQHVQSEPRRNGHAPSLAVGLWCDAAGTPVAADVLTAPLDRASRSAHIRDVAQRFGCEWVVSVGVQPRTRQQPPLVLKQPDLPYVSRVPEAEAASMMATNGFRRTSVEGQIEDVDHNRRRYVVWRPINGNGERPVLETNLPRNIVPAQVIYDRYGDMSRLSRAFAHDTLWHGHNAEALSRPLAQGHLLVRMLAYSIERELECAWMPLGFGVAEGLGQLAMLPILELRLPDQSVWCQTPAPNDASRQLLDAVGVTLPEALPLHSGALRPANQPK